MKPTERERAARALGRQGGLARARNLTKARRREIATMGWQAREDKRKLKKKALG